MVVSRRWTALLVSLVLGLTMAACGSDDQGKGSSTTASGDGVVKVYFTRHGRTMLNETDRVQGWADSPLMPKGEEVATKIGEGFAKANVTFDAAYSADMVRHFSTATLMLKGAKSDLTVTRNPDLREVSFGAWEGEENKVMQTAAAKKMGLASVEEILTSGRKLSDFVDAIKATNPKPEVPAEDSATVADRALKALKEAAEAQAGKGGGSVLVVSSGLTITVVLERLGQKVNKPIENGAVNLLVYDKGQWKVETVNDLSFSK